MWGTVNPPLERRRGTCGVYQPPRKVLQAIPGVDLVEMPRTRENAFCCGAGRGTGAAFPDFAAWAVDQRLTEAKEVGAEAIVTACPYCRDNFSRGVSRDGVNLKVLDFAEVVLAATGYKG